MIIDLFLPLSLVFIMFTLGLGLTIDDFTNLIYAPRAFFVGMINQMILLPIAAFFIISLMGITKEMAVGIMILASCPGGVTSNLSFWLKADAGTSTTTDAAEVTSWTEQAGSVTNTGSAGSVPTYLESGINYNPSLNFDGSSESLTINDLSNLPSGAEERSLIIVGKLGSAPNIITRF